MQRDVVIAAVVRHTRRTLPDAPALDEALLDRPFAELGMDSLHLTEITLAVLMELDVYLPMAEVTDLPTPRAFVEKVLAAAS